MKFLCSVGAIPLLSMNLQRGVIPCHPVPDAWHHQMAFGGGAKGRQSLLGMTLQLIKFHCYRYLSNQSG